MDMKKSKRFLLILGAAYWIMVIMIYACAFDQFRFTPVKGDALSPVSTIGEVSDGITVTQQMTAPAEQITEIQFMPATYGRQNAGTLNLLLQNSQGAELFRCGIDVSTLEDSVYASIPLEQPVQAVPGESLTLTMTTEGCIPGDSVTIYYGNSIHVGRTDVPQPLSQEELYTLSGTPGTGKLCVRLNGYNALNFYRTYWFIVLGLFAVLAAYALIGYRKAKQGKYSGIVAICVLYCKYQFLISQLVSRDFKVKYKRSILGMAWSFLNPLLTMAVQYVVFSTLFKSDIPNYPVYLLSGIVLFNYFNEAVTLGMASITGNAALIKKVYVPKYIYPISKLISSSTNFAIALLPLLLVMIFTKTPLQPALLLLVFDFLCMMVFIMGMILLMCTAMVFFQDMQFLWGVLSMIWMYLTPIIYPETIIARQFLPLYRLNPMYHYVTFARTCIIDGISPEPLAYLWCILSASVVLLLGIFVFRRHQDKFVLDL